MRMKLLTSFCFFTPPYTFITYRDLYSFKVYYFH